MNQIFQFLISHGALILFLVGFIEQIGLPFPGAPFLLAAGALAASGKFDLLSAVCWASAGCVVADAIWFFLGHRGKSRVFRMFPHLQAVQVKLERATLAKTVLHGTRMLTVAKFIPLGQVVPMHAGALEVGRLRFLIVDAFTSVIYAAVYAALGFAFHNQLEQVVAVLQKLGTVSLVLIGVGVAAYVVHWFVKHHRKKEARPLPKTGQAERKICFS
ncbi:MAG TPA: DedA family protein [Candidatus Acidoferrum sp.]|nr:DedA family protein [Candidatus Acidoferrum sp.]